jgi:hypothetical protein
MTTAALLALVSAIRQFEAEQAHAAATEARADELEKAFE